MRIFFNRNGRDERDVFRLMYYIVQINLGLVASVASWR